MVPASDRTQNPRFQLPAQHDIVGDVVEPIDMAREDVKGVVPTDDDQMAVSLALSLSVICEDRIEVRPDEWLLGRRAEPANSRTESNSAASANRLLQTQAK